MSCDAWKVIGVSVRGFDHCMQDKTCEDAFAYEVTRTGFLVCAISDGAGSAPRSEQGAQTLSAEVVRCLAVRLQELECDGVASLVEREVRLWVEDAVDAARRMLSTKSKSGSLGEFNATLLGSIAGREGGVFFHIGDGACFATRFDDLSTSIVSAPENGEYANETYFATQDEWRDHLRISSFGPEFDLIAIMSDGVTPFAMTMGARGPFPGFFAPLNPYLAENSPEKGQHALTVYFEDERVRGITGDDKTMIWALREAGRHQPDVDH